MIYIAIDKASAGWERNRCYHHCCRDPCFLSCFRAHHDIVQQEDRKHKPPTEAGHIRLCGRGSFSCSNQDGLSVRLGIFGTHYETSHSRYPLFILLSVDRKNSSVETEINFEFKSY